MDCRVKPGNDLGERPATESLSSLTRLLFLHLQRGHVAGDGESVVVEDELARDAVLVELEGNDVDRGLLALAPLTVGELVEIADRHWPARELVERRNLGRSVRRRLRAGRDRLSDQRERVVELRAGFRAVKDGQFEHGLAGAK